jgi:isopenicillin-N N-acyltransferase-like protein
MLKRLDNIDVYCARLGPMVEFYRDTLGLEFVLPYQPQEGWAGFTAGDVTIYLIETGLGSLGDPRVPGGSPGIDSFAFEVDDLDDAIAELGRRGVSWAGDIVESPWYRYRGFYDPEGNLLYITRPDDRALGRA